MIFLEERITMKKQLVFTAIIALLALELILAGCTPKAPQPQGNSNPQEPTVLAGTNSKLFEFNKEAYEAAKASDKIVLLYFYAKWCPECKKEVPKMQAAFNELTTDNVVGFRVHYNDDQTGDDAKALAREYGIAFQHTKVILKNGQKILKSPESWDKERYLTEITNALNA